MNGRAVLILAVVVVAQQVASARAQEVVSVAVFRTGTKDAGLKPLAETLDPVVLGELDKIESVQVSARPPLDLHATQLALDCIGETGACLRSVAEQAAAEAVLSPSIERAGDETVVTLLYFDARGQGELKSSTRRYTGADFERAALDAVPVMLRELFGIAAPAEAEPVAPAEQPAVPESDFGPQEPKPERSAFPAAPVAITAAGVVFVGVGLAFGLKAKATEDEYADALAGTMEQVDAAHDKLDDAQTEATIANIGIGVGAAVIAVGAALWIVELSGDDDAGEGAWLAPRLGPGEAGLSLSGRL
jgi:hypothetical protein